MHEGNLLKRYIEEKRGRVNQVAAALKIPRASLYRLYGREELEHEVKEKLAKAKIIIPGLNDTSESITKVSKKHELQVVPRTVEELLELYKRHEATQDRLIAQQGRELDTVYKYVGELEDKLGIKK